MHRTLNVSLHYLVKYKRSTVAKLLMCLTQYHRFASEHYHTCVKIINNILVTPVFIKSAFETV